MAKPLKWGLVAATAAGCAYVGILDPNTTTILPPCPFRSLTGFDCPGCGLTRALHATLRGDLVGSLDHNVFLLVFVAVAMVWFTIRTVRARMGHEPRPLRISRPWAFAIMGLVAAFWFARNLPWEPFRWLDSPSS